VDRIVWEIVRQLVREIVLRVDMLYFLIVQKTVYPSDLQQIVRGFVREIVSV
jgi:hypothetical protein